ncbi:hypothetical protein PAPYR_9604 [Paratrimastix pyriformis]|uniref:Uncharacterized protein n=1 Tax=Paratrimastix pyriformis TaxID=342808 RepID=A0ABQ8U803_9EUKA|nr:hypothetical protein PAPYR_9604 [Paratrimastix pyriformis]
MEERPSPSPHRVRAEKSEIHFGGAGSAAPKPAVDISLSVADGELISAERMLSSQDSMIEALIQHHETLQQQLPKMRDEVDSLIKLIQASPFIFR